MAEGTVDLPGVGKVKKTYALAGGGIVLVLAIVYLRKKSSSSSSSGTTGAAAGMYPPDGTTGNPQDPYSVDPATGQTYGNEASGAYGTGSYGAGSSYGGVAADTTTPTGNQPGPPFADNAAWSQYAIAQLTGQGMDSVTVTGALGAYLAGQQVSPAQESIINDATAVALQPPVTGPGGYPPSIRVSGSKSGVTSSAPGLPGRPGGLRETVRYNQADLSWNTVRNARRYRVRVWESPSGHVVDDMHTGQARVTVTNLHKKTHYGWHVQAIDTAGGGPWSASAHFTTK